MTTLIVKASILRQLLTAPLAIPSKLLPLALLGIALVTHADGCVRLEVTGASKAVVRNIRNHLGLSRLQCDIGELQLRNKLSSADKKISRALRALGYYHASWQLSHRPLDGGTKPKWLVALDLSPGEALKFSEIDVQIVGPAGEDPEFIGILDQLPLVAGHPVNHGKYEQSKKLISQRARNLGYFMGHFSHKSLRIDPRAATASARLVFISGPRYRFGAIHYAQTPLDAGFLSRYQTFASGEPYNAKKLIAFQNQLINSQYFEHVGVVAGEPGAEGQAVDIHVELDTRSKYDSAFGAGFSTDIGPRATYTLKNYYINSQGDSYQFANQWSPVQSSVSFQFQQPGERPVLEKTLWSLGWRSEDTDSAQNRGYLAEVARVAVLEGGWLLTRSLSLLNEHYEIADLSGDATLLYPGIALSRVETNDPRYPTKGWRLSASFKAGLEALLSDTSFAQATLEGKYISPLFGGRLIGRAGLGSTYVEDFSALPASLRFFAGGDNSVRGFGYESLGPKDARGEVIGGKELLTGSIEFDHPVKDNYGIAVFYDTGTAFDNSQFELYSSAGFGLRWRSPIGPVRLDFAFPIEEGGFQFHISMGPDL